MVLEDFVAAVGTELERAAMSMIFILLQLLRQ